VTFEPSILQFINAAISFYETTKAADAVAALKKSLKPKATVKRDGKWAVSDMDPPSTYHSLHTLTCVDFSGQHTVMAARD
jgi:hypothetical protein